MLAKVVQMWANQTLATLEHIFDQHFCCGHTDATLEQERLGAGQEAHTEHRAERFVRTNCKSRKTIDSMLSK